MNDLITQLLGIIAVLALLLLWLVVPASMASKRGRNPVGWFFVGIVNWPLAVLLLIVLPDLSETQ